MLDLDRLREVAEAADGPAGIYPETWWFQPAAAPIADGCAESDAAFIATFDPPTVLALLDRLGAAEAKVRRVETLADAAEVWDLGEVKPERMVFADDLRAALSDNRGDA